MTTDIVKLKLISDWRFSNKKRKDLHKCIRCKEIFTCTPLYHNRICPECDLRKTEEFVEMARKNGLLCYKKIDKVLGVP